MVAATICSGPLQPPDGFDSAEAGYHLPLPGGVKVGLGLVNHQHQPRAAAVGACEPVRPRGREGDGGYAPDRGPGTPPGHGV